MVTKSTRLGQMGRRGFMSALISMGVTGKAAANLTSEELKGLTDNPEKEVPRIKYYKHTNHSDVKKEKAAPKREPVYYTIPRERWERIETTKNAAERIGNKISSSGIREQLPKWEEISIGITNNVSDSRLGVVVEKTQYPDRRLKMDKQSKGIDLEKLRKIVPKETSGSVTAQSKKATQSNIPVKLTESVDYEQNFFDKSYPSVPGGCEIGQKNGSMATVATPAYGINGNSYGWVTAAHALSRESNIKMQQPNGGRTIGISDQYGEWGEADVGFIERADDYQYSIASENDSGDDYDWDIQGIVSNSRIEDMVENNEYSRFQGAKSGRSHSEVFRYDNVNWESTDGPVVFIDHNAEGGDSGGPYFELDGDGAYIMGVHAWGHNDETQAKGNTMEFAENVLNVVV